MFGGRRLIRENKGARVAIAVDAEQKKKICVYVDGHLIVRVDVAAIAPNEFDVVPEPYVIDDSFSLFADPNPVNTSVAVGVSCVQVRDVFLNAREVRLLGRFGRQDLDDGRSITQIAASLVKMGYPMRWCTKVLPISFSYRNQT